MRTLTVRELIMELVQMPIDNTVTEVAPNVYTVDVSDLFLPAPVVGETLPAVNKQPAAVLGLGPAQEPDPPFEMYVDGQPAAPKVNKFVREFPEGDE